MLLTLSPNLVPFLNKKIKGKQLAFKYCYEMIRQFSNRWHDGFGKTSGNCRGLNTQNLKMMIVIQKTIKAFKNMDKPMNAPQGIRKLIHRRSIMSA